MTVANPVRIPGKWPFAVSAGKPPAGAATSRPQEQGGCPSSIGGAGVQQPGRGDQVGLKRMVADVLLVAVWGAMIPGMMWLGYAAGF